jgi:hypothetical protein
MGKNSVGRDFSRRETHKAELPIVIELQKVDLLASSSTETTVLGE